MNTGEIPDSDASEPGLELQNPQWTQLIIPPLDLNAQVVRPSRKTRGFQHLDTHKRPRTNLETENSPEIIDLAHSEPNSELQTQLNTTVPEPQPQLPAPDLPPTPADSASNQPANITRIPSEFEEVTGRRRRRFDFEEWVQNEKRTHEYVYHQKFRVFHGADSDSEDYDYGDIDKGNDNDNDGGDSEGGEDEAMTQSYLSQSQEKQPGNGNVKHKNNNINNKERRRKMILSDSDSSSSSDNGSVIGVPKVRKRIKKAIPASKQRSNAQRVPESLPEDLPDSYEDALEGRPAFDYMSSRPPNSSGSRVQPSIIDLVKYMGTKASPIMRIAARTAARTAAKARSSRPLQQHRSKRQTPASDSDAPPKSTVANAKSKPFDSFQHKFFRGANEDEAMQLIRQVRKGSQKPVARTLKPSVNEPATKKRKISKPRRVKPPKPNVFHTTVLERQIEPKVSLTTPAALKAALISKKRFEPFKKPDLNTKIRVHVDISQPTNFVNLSRLSAATFTGSNILNILEGPEIWNGQQLSPALFGAPLASASEQKVVEDLEQLVGVCTNPNREISEVEYQQIYDYLLMNSGYLCDESQIVSMEFRYFVLKQWVRSARKALRHIVKQRQSSYYQVSIVQLLSLSCLLVARRVNSIDGTKMHKVQALACWTLYYTQTSISVQIDTAVSEREVPGIELAHISHELGALSMLPKVFARGEPSTAWHLLVVLTAVNSKYNNWQLCEPLLLLNVRVSMQYMLLLTLKWKWPAAPQLVVKLFEHYAQQKYFADPRGETISIPDYLWKTQFNGKTLPKQEFYLFLELLGATILEIKVTDKSWARRLAARVTPLNALLFPETCEVKTADLSSASHQYGLLILLYRLMDHQSKPSIAQIRDLILLNGAHLAIRMMAASAWSIVCRFIDLNNYEEVGEVNKWLEEDILQSNPPDTLLALVIQYALKIASFTPLIPNTLITKALKSSSKQLRTSTFKLMTFLPPKRLESLLNPSLLVEEDADLFVLICTTPTLIELWPFELSKPQIIAQLISTNRIPTTAPQALAQFYTSLLTPQWSAADKQLISAFGYAPQFELDDRLNIFKRAINQYPADHQQLLSILKTLYTKCSDLAYPSHVASIRQIVFSQSPQLVKTNKWFANNQFSSIEHTLTNLLQLITASHNYEGEYFFAYRLRKSVSIDNGQSFVSEIHQALRMLDPPQTSAVFDILINEIFAGYITNTNLSTMYMRKFHHLFARIAKLVLSTTLTLDFNPTNLLLAGVHFVSTEMDRPDCQSTNFEFLVELFSLGQVFAAQVFTIPPSKPIHETLIRMYTLGAGLLKHQQFRFPPPNEMHYTPLTIESAINNLEIEPLEFKESKLSKIVRSFSEAVHSYHYTIYTSTNTLPIRSQINGVEVLIPPKDFSKMFSIE